MKKTFVTVILTLCVMGTYAQNIMNVMFYNTENLFDTSDNPLKDDDEFTPEGARRWTNRRYWSKLTNLSRVIAAVDEDNAPEIIGLCEVENDSNEQHLRHCIPRALWSAFHQMSPLYR